MQRLVPLIPWLAGAVALGFLFAVLRNYRRKRLVQSLPTSSTKGIFIGLVELKGTAESEAPLRSYLAGTPCVHYAWKVEEHWERSKTETVTDADGKTKTETRTESGWSTVASGGETQSFYLEDSDGAVLVHPKGAQLDPETVFSRSCSRGDPLYYAKGPADAVADSTHERRFSEEAFQLHAPIYVVGKARERKDVVAPEIARDDTAELFLISHRSEEKVTRGFVLWGWLWAVLGFAAAVGALVAPDALADEEFMPRWEAYAKAAGVYLLALALGWAWTLYNSLIALRNRVLQGWALVDVQLKRRSDLIPNLVGTVSALRDYERRVQTELAALRAQVGATPPGKPGADYAALRPSLLVLQERYPDLKSDQAFLDLQRNLVDTENRIALARDYFNSIATHYNTALEQFPDGVVAALAGMRPRALLAAGEFERAAVRVEFAR